MADVERERVTALWREAAAAVAPEGDELDKLLRAYDALLHTPEAEGYQAWSLAERALHLCGRLREQLEQAEVDTERKVDAALRGRLVATEQQRDELTAVLERIAAECSHRDSLPEPCPVCLVELALEAARASLGVEGEP